MNKGKLFLYIALQKELKFSQNMLNRAERRRIRKYPNLLNLDSFKTSRALRAKFKRRAKVCISHKKGCVGVLFGKGKFGLDIEEIRERNFDAVADFCFSEDELRLYKKSCDINTFFQIYTTKEALVKARNLSFSELGLVNSLNNGGYDSKSFIIDSKFMVSVIFKGKKDIILKFL